jgi:FKBP-type peptidyl-prolyl cis-trans isomerase SlyD
VEITADRVVTIHCTLKDDGGAALDSSAGGGPPVYIQGHINLVAGLDKALEAKPEGALLTESVAAADGYGRLDESLIQRVPRRSQQGAGTIKRGMQFPACTDGGAGGHHH